MPYRIRLIEHEWTGRRTRKLLASGMAPEQNYTGNITHVETVDLLGGIVGVGEYFSVITIGTHSMRVQIDTGSSTLAVPVRGCKSCIPKANRYTAEDSVTGRSISCESGLCAADRCSLSCKQCSSKGACCSAQQPRKCGFSLRYADGSAASGALMSDVLKWGSLKANVTFGGILDNSPNFERAEVDGILGMAYRPLACNPSCVDPPFDALVKQGSVDDVFSICMTASGGKLMLGGFDATVAKSEVEYVKMNHVGSARYYRVALSGSIGLGDETIRLPQFRHAIVDTGTTLIVVSTATFSALRKAFMQRYCHIGELCGSNSWFASGMCVNLTPEDLAQLPAMHLTLLSGDSSTQTRLTLSASDYMVRYARGGRDYRCVGIMAMDGLGGMVVLGNTLMQRYVTIYDRREGRMGFAEAAAGCGDG